MRWLVIALILNTSLSLQSFSSSLSFRKVKIDPNPKGEFNRLVIPLKRANNLLLIEVEIDKQIGNLVFDTGAPYLVLNKTYFRDGVPQLDVEAEGINGRVEGLLTTDVKKLTINSLFYERLQADITPLGHLEDSRDVKILGLLGVSFFAYLEMELDIASDVLILHRLDKEGNRLVQEETLFKPDLESDLQYIRQHMVLDAKVGGKNLRFMLDTGAEANVLDLRLPDKVLKQFNLQKRTRLLGSDGRAREVLIGTLQSVEVGKYNFRFQQCMITNLGNRFNLPIDGILGYSFLSLGRVIINLQTERFSMYLYKKEAP